MWVLDWYDEIKKIVVVKETDKTVWVKDRWGGNSGSVSQRRKGLGDDQIFESWEAARSYLIIREHQAVESYNRKISESTGKIAAFSAMTEPKEE